MLKVPVLLSLALMIGPDPLVRAAENPGPLGSITSLGNAALDTDPALLADIPVPGGLGNFIKDRAAVLRLGKALFWDMQVGSDGIQSCGSCHFHAGADNRIKNQVSPGVLATPKDITFQLGIAPNYTLRASDFPLSTEALQNDVISSQGVFSGELTDPDGFHVNGIKVRRVEPRNAPTTANVAFNRLQFWDGRAKDRFNGVDPFGANPPGRYPTVYQAPTRESLWAAYDVIQSGNLNDASLASIAVGPVTSLFEMTSNERTFPELRFVLKKRGKRLKATRPLAKQIVAPTDSVLGSSSRYPMRGLKEPSYAKLIERAFKRQFWDSKVKQGGFTLMEQNFSLFWGLALREYMATLRADAGLAAHTPFDRYQAGDETALTEQQVRGLRLFVNTVANGGSNCNTCHVIPEFTRASIRRTAAQEALPGGPAKDATVSANGFITNYGVRRPGDDPGAGAPATFPNPAPTPPNTFKVPTLRNIALTSPYMHTGRFLTLEQVIDFYNGGRNDGEVQRATPLGLTGEQKADLIAFLRYGLTDERLLYDRAPFDHPQLFVPNGHPGDDTSVVPRSNGNAADALLHIPAVGRQGVAKPISAQNVEVRLGAQPNPYP